MSTYLASFFIGHDKNLWVHKNLSEVTRVIWESDLSSSSTVGSARSFGSPSSNTAQVEDITAFFNFNSVNSAAYQTAVKHEREKEKEGLSAVLSSISISNKAWTSAWH